MQPDDRKLRLQRWLVSLCMLWIRGVLYGMVLLAVWYIVRPLVPFLTELSVDRYVLLTLLPAVVFAPLLVGWLGAKLGNMLLAQRNSLSGIKRWEDKIVEEFAPDSRHPFPVVLVPWPSAVVRSLALLTETYKDPSGEGTLASVFIPNTPPRTGFLRVVPTEQLVHTEWTLPDLLQYHWSYGSGGRELFGEGPE